MKPILFNTPMVQAVRSDLKTETRRLIVLPEGMRGHPVGEANNSNNPLGFMYPGGIKRPRYLPGDILYVRETWQYAYDLDGNEEIIEGTGRYLYAADNPEPYDRWIMEDGTYRDVMPWRPSIHMPKEAAREFLLVREPPLNDSMTLRLRGSAMRGSGSYRARKHVGVLGRHQDADRNPAGTEMRIYLVCTYRSLQPCGTARLKIIDICWTAGREILGCGSTNLRDARNRRR